jgi:hypothetical protein
LAYNPEADHDSWQAMQDPYDVYHYIDEAKIEGFCVGISYEELSDRLIESYQISSEFGFKPWITVYPLQYGYWRSVAPPNGTGKKIPSGLEIRTEEALRMVAADVESCKSGGQCVFENPDDIRIFASWLVGAGAGVEAFNEGATGLAWGAGMEFLPAFFAHPCGTTNCTTPTYALAPTKTLERTRDGYDDYDYIMDVKARANLALASIDVEQPLGPVDRVLGTGSLSADQVVRFRPIYLRDGMAATVTNSTQSTLLARYGTPPTTTHYDAVQGSGDDGFTLHGPGYVYLAVHAPAGGSYDVRAVYDGVDFADDALNAVRATKDPSKGLHWLMPARAPTTDMDRLMSLRSDLGRAFEAFLTP